MRYLWTILFCVLFVPSMAQRIHIEEFAQYKKPLLGKASFSTDKQHALLDLITIEKGFQFFIGDAAITPTEGEGVVTLSLPDRTGALTIKHPEYGQLTWKVPGKGLRKRRHYHAYLQTESLAKAFQQQKQWAVLTVNPAQALIYLDSTLYPIQEGYLSLAAHGRVLGPDGQPLELTTDYIRADEFGRIYTEDGDAYLGQIGVFAFADNGQLTKNESGLFGAGGQAAEPVQPSIQWRWVESSNVDMIREMSTMMTAERALQSAAQVLKLYDGLLTKAANELARM